MAGGQVERKQVLKRVQFSLLLVAAAGSVVFFALPAEHSLHFGHHERIALSIVFFIICQSERQSLDLVVVVALAVGRGLILGHC